MILRQVEAGRGTRESSRSSACVRQGLERKKSAREINVKRDCGARAKQNGQKRNGEEGAATTREVRETGLKRGREKEKE